MFLAFIQDKFVRRKPCRIGFLSKSVVIYTLNSSHGQYRASRKVQRRILAISTTLAGLISMRHRQEFNVRQSLKLDFATIHTVHWLLINSVLLSDKAQQPNSRTSQTGRLYAERLSETLNVT